MLPDLTHFTVIILVNHNTLWKGHWFVFDYCRTVLVFMHFCNISKYFSEKL